MKAKENETNKEEKKRMRDRRFKMYLIWLANVNLWLVGKVLFSSQLDSALIIMVVKWSAVMGVFGVAGLSAVHMMATWASGRKKFDEKIT